MFSHSDMLIKGLVVCGIVGTLWTGIAVCYSIISHRNYNVVRLRAYASILTLAAMWASVDWGTLCDQGIQRPWALVPVMAVAGILDSLGMFLLVHTMRRGNHGISWTIGQSAIVMPFLFGLMMGKAPGIGTGLAGMGVIVISLILFGSVRRNEDIRSPRDDVWLLLAAITFVSIGIGQSLSTLPSYWPGWSDTGNLRPAISAAAATPFMWILFLKQGISRPTRSELRLIIVAALLVFAAQKFLYLALDCMKVVSKVSVVYPVCVSGSIVLFVLYRSLFMKERYTWTHAAGIGLGVAGIFLLCV